MEEQPQLSKKERRMLKKQQKEEARAEREQSEKKKSWFRWALGIGALVLIVWGIIEAGSGGQTPTQALQTSDQEWVKGTKGSPVSLVEYGDFECPACGTYFPIVQEIAQEFGEVIEIVYRHFPLTSIHPNAYPASLASEAAGMQGAFWEFHDLLYGNQSEWDRLRNPQEQFMTYAEELGLDVAQFETDYESNAVHDAVQADQRSGRVLGVNGTPTFFLNGTKLENPAGLEAFRQVILGALDEAGITPPAMEKAGEENTMEENEEAMMETHEETQE